MRLYTGHKQHIVGTVVARKTPRTSAEARHLTQVESRGNMLHGASVKLTNIRISERAIVEVTSSGTTTTNSMHIGWTLVNKEIRASIMSNLPHSLIL
jgi:hypothetical protein